MLNDELSQFNGTEHYYKHPLYAGAKYTDGVKFMAETYSAYWLIEFIFFYQMENKVNAAPFQIWMVKVNKKNASATITCKEDSDQKPLLRKRIYYTDLPDSIQLYFIDGILLLPSEY